MGCTSKEYSQVIDGINYRSKLFPATDGIGLAWRIGRLLDGNEVAQALLVAKSVLWDAAMAAPADGEQEDSEAERTLPLFETLFANMPLMASMVTKATHKVGPEEGAAIMRDVMRNTTCDQIDIGTVSPISGSVFEHFDEHFAGRYYHMMKVWWWVVRLGFAGP